MVYWRKEKGDNIALIIFLALDSGMFEMWRQQQYEKEQKALYKNHLLCRWVILRWRVDCSLFEHLVFRMILWREKFLPPVACVLLRRKFHLLSTCSPVNPWVHDWHRWFSNSASYLEHISLRILMMSMLRTKRPIIIVDITLWFLVNGLLPVSIRRISSSPFFWDIDSSYIFFLLLFVWYWLRAGQSIERIWKSNIWPHVWLFALQAYRSAIKEGERKNVCYSKIISKSFPQKASI